MSVCILLFFRLYCVEERQRSPNSKKVSQICSKRPKYSPQLILMRSLPLVLVFKLASYPIRAKKVDPNLTKVCRCKRWIMMWYSSFHLTRKISSRRKRKFQFLFPDYAPFRWENPTIYRWYRVEATLFPLKFSSGLSIKNWQKFVR